MNNLKHSDYGGENIISDTKTVSTKPECENTISKWVKRCPNCDKKLAYSSVRELRRSIKDNATCVSCRGLKRRTLAPLGGWTKACPKCGMTLSYTSRGVLNNSIRRNCVCATCASNDRKLPIPTEGWIRPCPRCHKQLSYSDRYKFERAVKSNFECSKCCNAVVLDQEVYYRTCPQCSRPIKHKDKHSFYLGKREGWKCAKCRHIGIKHTDESKRKLSIAHKGKPGHPHTAQHRQKITEAGNPMYGVHRYDELNPFYGKRHSEEARRKMRVAMCKKVLRMYWSHGRMASIGAGEKAYFDQLERERGWFGNRQHFVSHLGYFVDYYEPNHNIVVEYDEPRHYRHGHLREKDRVRMEQIKAHLGCEFWRYDAYRKQLVEF